MSTTHLSGSVDALGADEIRFGNHQSSDTTILTINNDDSMVG